MEKAEQIFTARVVLNGRITIPDTIRELLGIKEGDFVRVTVEKVNSREVA